MAKVSHSKITRRHDPPTEDRAPESGSDLARAPSTNPATNLLIADIVLRGASSLFRKGVERRVAKANYGPERADAVLDGRTILTTLALYGASKLATRSVPGLALVAGGLVLKTLYDRGRSREIEQASKGDDGQIP